MLTSPRSNPHYCTDNLEAGYATLSLGVTRPFTNFGLQNSWYRMFPQSSSIVCSELLPAVSLSSYLIRETLSHSKIAPHIRKVPNIDDFLSTFYIILPQM